jgi:SAM-dependent methyltransferase
MHPEMVAMIEVVKSRYPDIELEELYPHFPRMAMPDDLALSGYSWEDCHRGFFGAGGLFLVADVARELALKPGMRVLDLCCGTGMSSIFLAKHFGVQVIALDRGVDPTENWKRIEAEGLAGAIAPMRMDARDIRLPENYFDAVFCLNSYFYFGTDDLYLPYLARFVRAGRRIGIASPCYAGELTPDTPREFLYDAPDFVESYAVHSPPWWRQHFEKTGLVRIQICREHPQGRELWLDNVRWLIEKRHPCEMDPAMREMVLQEIVMLLTDRERFVTYLTLVAEKG